MKVREQRKHSFNEKRSRKLRSELLAFTMGVSLYTKNMSAIVIVRNPPITENAANSIPISSSKVRNSMLFKSQLFLSSFDLYSKGHGTHVSASVKDNNFLFVFCFFN